MVDDSLAWLNWSLMVTGHRLFAWRATWFGVMVSGTECSRSNITSEPFKTLEPLGELCADSDSLPQRPQFVMALKTSVGLASAKRGANKHSCAVEQQSAIMNMMILVLCSLN